MIRSIQSVSELKEIIEVEFYDTILIYVDNDPDTGILSEDLELIKNEFQDSLRVYQIDSRDMDLVDYLSVNDIPTIILYKSNCDEIFRYEGLMDGMELDLLVSTNL